MTERERQDITVRQHQKLARDIEESPLDNPVRDLLLKKLKVGSTVGIALVVTEFATAMHEYRCRCLPSYRKRHNRPSAPLKKACA